MLGIGRLVEAVQHLGHPGGEMLDLPDALKRSRRVLVEPARVAAAVPGDQSVVQVTGIGESKVQAFRARRRHYVCGVADQEQLAETHRVAHQAAHRGDALVEDLPVLECPARGAKPYIQLLPDAIIRPVRDVFVRGDLQVEAADGLRAHAVHGKAPLVERVDELVGGRLYTRQDAQPTEWVLPLKDLLLRRRDAGPAYAVP